MSCLSQTAKVSPREGRGGRRAYWGWGVGVSVGVACWDGVSAWRVRMACQDGVLWLRVGLTPEGWEADVGVGEGYAEGGGLEFEVSVASSHPIRAPP